MYIIYTCTFLFTIEIKSTLKNLVYTAKIILVVCSKYTYTYDGIIGRT